MSFRTYLPPDYLQWYTNESKFVKQFVAVENGSDLPTTLAPNFDICWTKLDDFGFRHFWGANFKDVATKSDDQNFQSFNELDLEVQKIFRKKW